MTADEIQALEQEAKELRADADRCPQQFHCRSKRSHEATYTAPSAARNEISTNWRAQWPEDSPAIST